MEIDEFFGNDVGDNLTDDENAEVDENERYNWVNNPIRKLFDNPKNLFHQQYLNAPVPNDD